MRKALLVVPIVMMVGCQGPSFERISRGMTRDEVILALGNPDRVALDGIDEFLIYNSTNKGLGMLSMGFVWVDDEYYVKLTSGKVSSFGVKRYGESRNEFESSNPSQRIQVDQKSTSTLTFDLATELAKLDKLKKDGLISAEDYEVLKKRAIEKAKE